MYRKLIIVVISALIIVALATTTLMFISSFLARRNQQRDAVISNQMVDALSSLVSDQGLANMPELGVQNTDESQIQASFMVARIAHYRLKDLKNQLSAEELYKYAANLDKPIETRLMAFAALYYLDDKRYENGKKLAVQAMSSQPNLITERELARYLAIAETAYILEPNIKLHKLVKFEPRENKNLQRIATSAIALRYLFENQKEIKNFFLVLRKDLKKWASGDAKHIQQILLSNLALNGTPAQKNNLSQKDILVKGCQTSKFFISTDGNPKSKCSLINTYFAWMAGIIR